MLAPLRLALNKLPPFSKNSAHALINTARLLSNFHCKPCRVSPYVSLRSFVYITMNCIYLYILSENRFIPLNSIQYNSLIPAQSLKMIAYVAFRFVYGAAAMSLRAIRRLPRATAAPYARGRSLSAIRERCFRPCSNVPNTPLQLVRPNKNNKAL